MKSISQAARKLNTATSSQEYTPCMGATTEGRGSGPPQNLHGPPTFYIVF